MSHQVGQKAPEFIGLTQTGKEIALKDYKGKKVVLYFYPKDNTPGCTKQACNLRDNYELLQKKEYVVIGVSNDSVASHQRFSNKYELPFPLISDKEKIITKAYDVGTVLTFPKRTTFVIDEKGYIVKIITSVKTTDHTQQILA
ncbi:MAG: peroxiredoxin [Bacteroidota bacterium]